MAKHSLNVLWCSHHKDFKVCVVTFNIHKRVDNVLLLLSFCCGQLSCNVILNSQDDFYRKLAWKELCTVFYYTFLPIHFRVQSVNGNVITRWNLFFFSFLYIESCFCIIWNIWDCFHKLPLTITNISGLKVTKILSMIISPGGNYILKVNSKNSRTTCEICPKLTMASF